jgi:hypothetical protein
VSELSHPVLSARAHDGYADEGEFSAPALPALADGVHTPASRAQTPALAAVLRAMPPAAQAAAVAAGSFIAGAAVVGLVHRRQRRALTHVKRRRLGRGGRAGSQASHRGGPRAAELVQIVSSRSLLVDVHLLGRPGER